MTPEVQTNVRSSRATRRVEVQRVAAAAAALLPGDRAFFLSESVAGLNEGAHFLDRLTASERQRLGACGRRLSFSPGESVFAQGEPHAGIFIIERGRVRVFYAAPSGREITLAYWTPGHFCGGPEISGDGVPIWSGEALEDCRALLIPSAALRALIVEVPNFALCLIEGLVAKGKSYSAMSQMLGTRSVIERLAQFLINVADLYGEPDGRAIVINRRITHDQVAAMVGSTRQWVTMMLKRFQKKGIVSISARGVRIDRPDLLLALVSKEG